MKRKIYNELLEWKHKRNGKVAIMIDGARRIGKSYIAEEFARNEYKSYILIDFNNAPTELTNIFENYLAELDKFFNYLSLYFRVTLHERNSVIIFDEVQLYPKARAAIKYLVKDGRYDFIETGSLVSINRNVKDIVIPSEEHRIDMHPMDFEEFLWAIGEAQMAAFIRECFATRTPLGPLHRKAIELFRHYLIVGGMPQAILQYIYTNKDFVEVDAVKRDILKLYKADIEKYAENNETKVKAIFDEIPAALSRHEKKFKLSTLIEKARFRDYSSAFFWLSESRVVNLCYNSTAPDLGLRLNQERTTLKCYMADTGLLISHAFNERIMKNENVYLKLALGKLELNEGMLMENIVAQMLRSAGHDLFFFSQYSEEAENKMEIDFLISKPVITNRHNICPIEVKSGSKYTLKSLGKLRNKYSQMLAESYVLHTADLKIEGDTIYLPLYMTGLL